ncbi:MAG: hypothetical protein IJD16_06025 [Desulfovibrio sp.]|nr:hypothetical protein [Desulfovibrio sp.]
MADKHSAGTDNGIIDLIELLEAGSVPTPTSKSEGDDINSHMRNLNDSSGTQDGVEIDALLAQMESRKTHQPSAQETTEPGYRVDPHEQLDMTGMGEVDKLLNDLDIPQQPSGTAKNASETELDDAVDELLNSIGPGTRPTESVAPPAADTDALDNLLSSDNGKSENKEQEMDLDALLGDLGVEAPPAPAAPASQENTDLDALLSDLAVDNTHSSATASPVTTSEPTSSTNELDALLENIVPVSPEKAAASSAHDDVLDDLLLQGKDNVRAEAVEQEMDLDALLGDLGMDAAPAAPATEPEMNLDDLLAEASINSAASVTSATASGTSPVPDVLPPAAQAVSMPTMEDMETLKMRMAACEEALQTLTALQDSLKTCRAALHNAEERLASLETLSVNIQEQDSRMTAMEHRLTSLENRLVQDVSRFDGLADDTAQTRQKLQTIEVNLTQNSQQCETLSTRLDQAVHHMDSLEARFSQDVDNAAAAAAARILREEIARLMAE